MSETCYGQRRAKSTNATTEITEDHREDIAAAHLEISVDKQINLAYAGA